MRHIVPIALSLSALVLLSAIIFVMYGWDDAPDGPVEEPQLPEGFSMDVNGVLTYTDETEWHVLDRLHAYMEDGYAYTGYSAEGASIVLSPGSYDVSAAGVDFTVIVPGSIVRDAEWEFAWGEGSHHVSVSFSIDAGSYSACTTENREWNDYHKSRYRFEDLPRFVAVDDTVRSIADQLGSEYTRIGGDVSDRQGYADFIASFVQKTVKYPPSVSGKGEDYSVWGSDEYWCMPSETLYHMIGDCDDKSALLCALYSAAGYEVAMGGHTGHVFAGVVIDGFEERSDEELPPIYSERSLSYGKGILAVDGKEVTYGDTTYYAVETIKGQTPVGYLGGGTSHLDQMTKWGWAGFYPARSGR